MKQKTPWMSTGAMRDFNIMTSRFFGGQQQQQQRSSNNNNNEMITSEAISFFTNPNQEFLLSSITIILPSQELPLEFFSSNNNNNNNNKKWKNLKKCMLSCKNEGRILSVLPKQIEELFICCAKLVPKHIGFISSRFKNLRIFSSINLQTEYFSYLKLKSNIQIISRGDHFDETFYRCCKEFKVIDPLKRFLFGFEKEEEEEDVIKNNEDLKKCVDCWGITGPFLKSIDWKKYYDERIRISSEEKKEEEDKHLCNEEKEYRKQLRKEYQEKIIKDLDDIFIDKKNNNSIKYLSTEEEYKRLKDSLFVNVHDSYYGYEIYTSLYSLIGTGDCFKFQYYFHLRSRWSTCEDFEGLKIRKSSIRMKRRKRNKVGYKSIGDDDTTIPLFFRSSNDYDSVNEFHFPELYLLRKIESGVFGKKRRNIMEIRDLVRFVYLIGATNLEIRYGEDNDLAPSRNWILSLSEQVYNFKFSDDEVERKSWVDKITEDEDMYIKGDCGEQEEELERRNEEDRGGGGGCSIQ